MDKVYYCVAASGAGSNSRDLESSFSRRSDLAYLQVSGLNHVVRLFDFNLCIETRREIVILKADFAVSNSSAAKNTKIDKDQGILNVSIYEFAE